MTRRISLGLALTAVPSLTHSDGWWIGLLFGFTILLWTRRPISHVRAVLFAGIASLVFVGTVHFTQQAFFGRVPGLAHLPASPLFIAVLVGGALLVSAHAVLLGASARRIAVAIPGIFIVWYSNFHLLGLLGTGDVGVAISVWQAIYLVFMTDFDLAGSGAEQRLQRKAYC